MERIVLGKFVWQKYYGRNLPSKMDEQSPQKTSIMTLESQ
jgi:hypothetical protein